MKNQDKEDLEIIIETGKKVFKTMFFIIVLIVIIIIIKKYIYD